MKKKTTECGQAAAEWVCVMVLLVILLGIIYGALELTDHAKRAHAGEVWQAEDIALYFDSCRPNVRCIDGKVEVHYCEVRPGMSLGLIIDTISQTIITGFQAQTGYWKNCR